MKPVLDWIQNYFQGGGSEWECGFRMGGAAALGLLFLLLILYFILRRLILGPHRLGGVYGSTEAGEYFISARAVSDLIFALGDEFRDLEIGKVLLHKDSGGLCKLDVSAEYLPSSGALAVPDLVAQFQKRALESVGSTLGITKIKHVNVKISRAKRDKHRL